MVLYSKSRFTGIAYFFIHPLFNPFGDQRWVVSVITRQEIR